MRAFPIRAWKRLAILAAMLALMALGLTALGGLLRNVHAHQVRQAFHAIPSKSLLACLALTASSYLLLTFYDVLALRAIGRRLPYVKAALASFTSYTLSHNLGLSLLTGGSARYRIYAAEGLSLAEVAQVIALASATFWGGVFATTAIACLLWPRSAAISALGLPPPLLQAIAAAVLLAFATLLFVAGRGRRTLCFHRWRLPLPGAPAMLLQLAIGALDLAAASAALFVLVPGLGTPMWPAFFIAYAAAIIVALLSHVPGGVGVFEAVILAALPPEIDRAQWAAALIAYRLIYYLLPFAVAASLVLVREGQRLRHPMGRTLRGLRMVTTGLAPLMTAALVFLCGAMLLISGSLPPIPHRIALLDAVVPLAFIEASHMAGSLVGAALLVLSAGLYRRLDGAFWLTRGLLIAGACFSLAKGLDYEEAAIALLIAGMLQWTKPAFYRRTRLINAAFTPGWIATVATVVGLSLWIGFFAYKHVEYSNDLWWHFAERGDASRFLRASLGTALFLAVVALWRLFRPAPTDAHPGDGRGPPEPALTLARRADANLALTGDKYFLSSESGRCFLMYRQRGHSWIVMGDPVGDRREWADLLWRLRERADAAQGRLLLYQISADCLPLAIETGLQVVKYGEEAHIDLRTFSLDGPGAKSLRHAARRAARDGASFEILPARRIDAVMDELARVSTDWLQAKRQKEKHFSIGSFNPAYMRRFDCALVRREGAIVAFANIWTTPDRSELSVDLMRHSVDAPYGTMDFLFTRLMQWGRDQGYAWFNLGMAPLSGLEARRLAPLWSKLGALVYEHGNRLYGFEGLRAYKTKFSPLWEPRYVAGGQGLALGRALIDLQSLIGDGRG